MSKDVTDYEEVIRERRLRRGQRPNWVYHVPCDDGEVGGEGHMQVRDTEDGFKYKCKTCGWEIDYDEHE